MNAISKLATFTADEFDLMARRGDFARRSHVELLDGMIYEMNAQYVRHARIKSKLALLLSMALASKNDIEVIGEVSVKINARSVPMPDIVIARRLAADDFVPVENVLLLVEIADSTLRTDLGHKRKLYAAAGVPEYWVVDVEGKIIHQHAQPEGETYAIVQQMAFGVRMQALTMDELILETAGLSLS
jgi:Uma2 family endonuclease